jgi:hypothetical protein
MSPTSYQTAPPRGGPGNLSPPREFGPRVGRSGSIRVGEAVSRIDTTRLDDLADVLGTVRAWEGIEDRGRWTVERSTCGESPTFTSTSDGRVAGPLPSLPRQTGESPGRHSWLRWLGGVRPARAPTGCRQEPLREAAQGRVRGSLILGGPYSAGGMAESGNGTC